MESARNAYESNIETRIDHDTAPPSVVRRIHDEILDAIEHNSNIILLTGESGKGKSTLLRAMGKNLPAHNRLIFFNGTDFLSSHSANENKQLNNSAANNKGMQDFTVVKDFIRESAELEDKLTIIVDAADRLPTNVLSDLLNINNQIASKNNGINLILAGRPDFKKQLDEIENSSAQNLIHCSMDELNEEDVYAFATNKEYRIKPYSGELQFEQDSLEALSTYVVGNQQLLDVLLEWCSILINEQQIDLVTKNIATSAIARAEQFSKDNNILLINSYPSYEDVQDFIEEDKVKDTPRAKDTNVYSRVTSKNKDHVPAYIPTITSKVDEALSARINNINDFEDEVMPTQWVPAPKKPLPNKKPLLFLATIIVVLAISLVLLIAHRLQLNVFNTKNSVENQIIQNEAVEDAGSAANKFVEIENAAPVATENLDEAENLSQAENNELNTAQELEVTTPVEPEGKAEGLVEDDQLANLADDSEVDPSRELEFITPVEPASKAESVAEDSELNTVQEPEGKAEGLAKDDQLANLADDSEVDPSRELEFITPVEPASKAENIAEDSELNTVQEPEAKAKDLTKEDQLATIEQRDTSSANRAAISLTATEIDNRLATARRQFAAKNLTTPAGNNAFETYQSILSKVPNHAAALQGIQNIHNKYVSWANYYLRINQTERAKYFYSKALEVAPEDEASIKMLRNLTGTKNSVTTDASTPKQLRSVEKYIQHNRETHTLNSTQTHQQGQTSIGELLVKAKRQLQNKNLTTPPSNNAYATYQQVLKSAPNNSDALAGISIIKKTYIVWAEQDVKDKNYRRAALFYNKALAIDPADAQLVHRLQQINSLRSTRN